MISEINLDIGRPHEYIAQLRRAADELEAQQSLLEMLGAETCRVVGFVDLESKTIYLRVTEGDGAIGINVRPIEEDLEWFRGL
jgi:hypothetical protein